MVYNSKTPSSIARSQKYLAVSTAWQLEDLRSRIQMQLSKMGGAHTPQLRPLRSDTATVPAKRKNSPALGRIKAFNSDPVTSVGPARMPLKSIQPVKRKRVTIKTKPMQIAQQQHQKPKAITEATQKPKESNKTRGNHTATKKSLKPQKKTKQSQPAQRKLHKFQCFGRQQSSDHKVDANEIADLENFLRSKISEEFNFGLNSNGSQEFDFDGFVWRLAKRRLVTNRLLLLEARADLATLRTENQKLRNALMSTKREGEKYKRQLQNEVFKKLITNEM